VQHALAAHAFADAAFVQQINRALLEHARPDSLFAVLAAARLYNDRFNSFKMKQVSENETRGSRPDNANLRFQGLLLTTG
jgi:hypothetical protein